MTENRQIRPLARSKVYEFLALGFSYPDASVVAAMKELLDPLEAGLEVLGDRKCTEAVNATYAAVERTAVDDLEATYVGCFGHTISKECPPYEAEYEHSHIFQKSQNLADISGFYKAFGLHPARDCHERPDHISTELEFMHFLCVKEAHAHAKGHADDRLSVCIDAQERFLGDHLGRWASGFVRRLEAKSENSLYGLLAGVLASFLASEMRMFGLELDGSATPALQDQLEDETAGCYECAEADLTAPVEQGGSL